MSSRVFTTARAAVASTVVAAVTCVIMPVSASADTAPVDLTLPATVSADALPTTQIDGVAWDQLVVGNTVYVAGKFAKARPAGAALGTNEVARDNMLAYDVRTGELLTTFAPSFNAQVRDLAVSPDGKTIFAVGSFTAVNGTPRYRFVALDATTGAVLSSFSQGTNTDVYAVAVSSSTVYIGGAFTGAAGATRNRVAAYSLATGALLPFAAQIDNNAVRAIVVAPDEKSLVVGGNFTTVAGSGSTGYGLVRLDATTGAASTLAVNADVRNAGTQAAILSLVSDGTSFYGSGYVYGQKGNLEGSFSADWATGSTNWVLDCHGDTYSVAPVNGALYMASHQHYCGNSGGFPQTDPWTYHHSTAVTLDARGTNTADIYGYPDHPGTPSPKLLEWFPQWTIGTYTGQGQATWSVAGNADYVVYGGEFLGINGTAQQGLTRFARTALAPNKMGPTSSTFVLTATSTTSGQVDLAWPGISDPDNETLTYDMYRGQSFVYRIANTSPFWAQPTLRFSDTGVTPGSTQTYKVVAKDDFGNAAWSEPVSVVVSSTVVPLYEGSVMADSPTRYWRLGDAVGSTTAVDRTGNANATLRTGATLGQTGALVADTDTSALVNGTNGLISTTKAVAGPQTFGVEAWFSTTSKAGGKIVGFGSSATGLSTTTDRHVYMLTSGKLVFGIYNRLRQYTVTSTASYNDGRWHHVYADLSGSGMRMFVDGALVGSSTSTKAAQQYNGYWRIGGDRSWSGANYFNGRIDEVAVYSAPLTEQRVKQHYVDGTNTKPVAAFTSSTDGLVASVDGSTSVDADGALAGYQWTWGDGAMSTGVTATHVYHASGTYLVRLTVTDAAGATSVTSGEVTVSAPNVPPTASFAASATQLAVAFDATASTDTDGTLAGYSWDFGDGSTGTGATTSHLYAAGGSYDVVLTVTDDRGASTTATQTVTVAGIPVYAEDSFDRSVTGSWGAAPVGGGWTQSGIAAQYGVDGTGVAQLSQPGWVVRQQLSSVAVLDSDARIDVGLSSVANGGGIFASLSSRASGWNNEYRAKAWVKSTGAVNLYLTAADGAETILAGAAVSGLVVTAGDHILIRLQTVGTAPTTVRAKVWKAGTDEPATWQVTATDSTASLQDAGAVGVNGTLSGTATTGAVTMTFDDLSVQGIAG